VLSRLEILCNAWGLAGCFRLAGRSHLMCHWQEAHKYYRKLLERTEPFLDYYTEESVAEYLVNVEETFRGHVLEAVRKRDSPANWGEALGDALERFAVIWGDNMHILQPSVQATPRQGGSSGSGQDQRQQQQQQQRQQQQQQQKPKDQLVCTCKVNERGQTFCKKYQDNRSCTTPCRGGFVHACDIELESGKPCNKGHPRFQHDPAKHGQPRYRSNN